MRARTECSSLGDCPRTQLLCSLNCLSYLPIESTCLFYGAEDFEARVLRVQFCLQEIRVWRLSAPLPLPRSPESSGVRLSAPSWCAAPERVAESTAVCVCVYSPAVWTCMPGPTRHGRRAVGLGRSRGACCWGLLARVRHSPWHGPPLRQLGPPHSMVAASCRRK